MNLNTVLTPSLLQTASQNYNSVRFKPSFSLSRHCHIGELA